MFVMWMPATYKIGDTAEVKINDEPQKLTWRDAQTLAIEPDDARTIVDRHIDGDLMCFTSSDAKPKTQQRYWIAINGATCAMSSFPFTHPTVIPPATADRLSDHREATAAQQLCLEAPIPEVEDFLISLAPDVVSGRIKVIEPEHPEPPTTGPTMWEEDMDRTRGLQ